jgi:hypothetical protein
MEQNKNFGITIKAADCIPDNIKIEYNIKTQHGERKIEATIGNCIEAMIEKY